MVEAKGKCSMVALTAYEAFLKRLKRKEKCLMATLTTSGNQEKKKERGRGLSVEEDRAREVSRIR